MKATNDKGHDRSEVAAMIAAFAAVAGIIVTIFFNFYQFKSEEKRRKRESYAEFKSAVQKLEFDALAGRSPSILDGDCTAGFVPYNKLGIYMSDATKDTIMRNYETIRTNGANVSFPGTPKQRNEISNAFRTIVLTLDGELNINEK